MKVLTIIHRNRDRAANEFTALLESAPLTRRLYAEGTAREIYSRTDGSGSVLILEVQDDAAAKAIADALPVIKAGLMHYEIYDLDPYRGGEAAGAPPVFDR